jgi:hypothetical protein
VLECASGMLHWLTINSINLISINKRKDRHGSLENQNVHCVGCFFSIRMIFAYLRFRVLKDDKFRPKSCCMWYDPGRILQRQQNAPTMRYILRRTNQTHRSSVRCRSYCYTSIEPSYLGISRPRCHLTIFDNFDWELDCDDTAQPHQRRPVNYKHVQHLAFLGKKKQIILTRQRTRREERVYQV